MTRAAVLTQYAELTQFEATIALAEANRRRTSCRTSAIYVHYCRQAAIEPYVVSAGGASSCIGQAYSIKGRGDDSWTCVYVGEVAISSAGRCAATRFYYEFGGGGYLKQAPALELLCSMLYRLNQWIPYHTNPGRTLSKLRVYLPPHAREQFAAWCNQNVRVAWREFPDSVDTAKQRVREVEKSLLTALAPLLNVKGGTNAFKPTIQKLRVALRQDSLTQFHPKPLH